MNRQKSILLIHPPVGVLSEPPAGMARIAGFLRACGVDCKSLDLNIAAMTMIAQNAAAGAFPGAADAELRAASFNPAVSGARHDDREDTWTRRAKKHLDANLASLQNPDVYKKPDRYRRAVMDVNRVLHKAGRAAGVRLSLSDYAEPRRSTVRGRDLRDAARNYRDNLFFFFFEPVIAEVLAERSVDIVGISVGFMSQALCAAAIAGFIRSAAPDIRIVFGGGLITSWMHLPGFSNPLEGFADDMIAGPGEGPLARMCGVSGLADGFAPPGAPYRFASPDPAAYLSPVPVLPVAASDGCHWRKCAFCPERAEKRRYRSFSPEALAGEYGAGSGRGGRGGLIHFLDNTLTPAFMKHLAGNPPEIPWYGFARITEHLADPDFTKALARSGCVMLQLGIESGDQDVLDAMAKGTSVETASRVLKALRSASISVYGYFLFGTPAETEKSAEKTKTFIRDHAAYIDFLNLSIFNLPARSDAMEDLETRSFYDGDLSLYRDFVHPQGWNRDRVRRFLQKSLGTDEAIRRIMLNDPPFFTSRHAPFFKMFSGL